ncbi:MAG TPA: histidine phosphatase family protein [Propionibacteriaceae bacterium]|nr:histidine phosphatase family protein [Propionibacteriaceae bacterium]
MAESIVHVVRHGEVENPDKVLYGRLPDFHLSALGRQMAERVAEHLSGLPVTHLRVSPLERARETMEPINAVYPEHEPTVDVRIVEAANVFEGKIFGPRNAVLFKPSSLWHLRNPLRPSWGEPYRHIVRRMQAAVIDSAAAAGDGNRAIVVSHQLPIWMLRSQAEGRRLVHDPRRRRCTLASVTSFTVVDGRISRVNYAEPATDLLPVKAGKSGRFRPGA